jgi:hypothetical protein
MLCALASRLQAQEKKRRQQRVATTATTTTTTNEEVEEVEEVEEGVKHNKPQASKTGNQSSSSSPNTAPLDCLGTATSLLPSTVYECFGTRFTHLSNPLFVSARMDLQ